MQPPTNAARPPRPTARPGRWLPLVVVLLTVAVFAGTLVFVTLRLRLQLREQIAGQDAHLLQDLASLQELADKAQATLEAPLDPAGLETNDDFAALLKTELLNQTIGGVRSLIAARLFDATGKLITTVPLYLTDAQLEPGDLATLHRFQVISHYHRSLRRDELYLDAERNAPREPTQRPVLEVVLPLRGAGSNHLIGCAQLLLDGQNVAQAFGALDDHLTTQALGMFLLGSAVLVGTLVWAFRRLQRSHQLLHERTQSLLKANAELLLAAKTSAVGALTSHLIHGLKNPLSGLQSFVANRPGAAAESGEEAWEQALGTTQRMQAMIQEIVRILREESATSHYELTIEELTDLLVSKCRPAAEEAGVGLHGQTAGTANLGNREANLVLLILENLIHNAVQATPRGGTVTLNVHISGRDISFEVRDQGPGLDEQARQTLFAPTQTTKAGGTGIGLAISKQLAKHLGADLELQETSAQGSVFVLRLPLSSAPSA